MAPLAYSIDQVVEITSIGRTNVYAAIRDGHLACRKVGRRTIILAKDLAAWLEAAPNARTADSRAA